MIRTLVVFVHPALEKSTANRVLRDGVTVRDLCELYLDFHIDGPREMALLNKVREHVGEMERQFQQDRKDYSRDADRAWDTQKIREDLAGGKDFELDK
jgi:hypothetical protein